MVSIPGQCEVVGADGVNSAVREWLNNGGRRIIIDNKEEDTKQPSSWLTAEQQGKKKKFQVKKYMLQSSGLRMKVLQLPQNFPLTDADGTTAVRTDNERLYTILSVTNGPTNRLRLGFLPTRNNPEGGAGIRTANSITRPDHEIWHLIKDGNDAKEWHANAFPRLDWDTLVEDDAEWERFAHANGTTFPPCQYCTGLQVSSPDETAGVVLAGDALHAFPPDLGQGVNSGLSDVLALDRALRGQDVVSGGTAPRSSSKEEEDAAAARLPTLGAALVEYERVRGPETMALIRLARIGAPYQYRQSHRKDRIGHFLWTLNIVLRLALNKISFGLIPPPALIMSMDNKLTFRQAMRRADLTTAGLHAAAAFLVCRTAVARKFLFRGRLANALPIHIAAFVFFLKLMAIGFDEPTIASTKRLFCSKLKQKVRSFW